MSENKDINIFKNLIKNYQDGFYNFDFKNVILRGKVIDKSEKIIWKDFLLCFKKGFQHIIGNTHTSIISQNLRELLHIDQEIHVRKGIKLTFEEWINLVNSSASLTLY